MLVAHYETILSRIRRHANVGGRPVKVDQIERRPENITKIEI